MKIGLAVMLITLSLALHAQVKFSYTPTGRHARQLAKIEDGGKKLDQYYKYKNRAQKKYDKQVADSLKRVARQRLPIDSAAVIAHLPDSSSREDSIAWALNTLARTGHLSEVEQYMEYVALLDSANRPKLDSGLLDASVNRLARQHLANKLPAESMSAQDIFPGEEAFPVDMEAVKDPREMIEELSTKVIASQMADVQKQMSKWKRKYVSMPNLSKPEEGIKRNSLQGEPFFRRIHLGGNVNILSTDPFSLDMDIQVGYKINRDLVVGGVLRWRETLAAADTLPGMSAAAHGFGGFVSQEIKANFYMYAEWNQSRNARLWGEPSEKAQWQQQYLAGIGRRFSLGSWATLSCTLLYDFNHRRNNLSPNPFVMRIGYSLEKVPLKSLKK